MRIITRLNIGGPARQAISLTEKLRPYGYETDLVTGSAGDREGEIAPPETVTPIRLDCLKRGVDPRADTISLRSLRRLMAERSPVIVHTHMAKAGTLGRIAAARSRVPVVVHTFHGHVLKEYFSPLVSRAFLLAEQRLARHTDALVAVSASVRDELLALGIGQRQQWRVVPLGLELEHLLGLLPASASSREALGVAGNGLAVGIVGRLAPIKDHGTFLRMCKQVLAHCPDVQFVVAGDGELRRDLERQFAPLGEKVRFLGWVTDLPTLYSALDVVVLTSRNEGTPVALIEASSAAKPVVATEVGGVADVVQDGTTGLLAASGDDAALAGHVVSLLKNPDLRQDMGAAGRQHVQHRYSSERLVDDMAQLYQELLERKLGK